MDDSEINRGEAEKPNVEILFKELLTLAPNPVKLFTPDDNAEKRRRFLAGEDTEVSHTYSQLAIDYEDTIARIQNISNFILQSGQVDAVDAMVYEDFSERYIKTYRLMEAAHLYNTAESEASKSQHAADFMRLNIELYGEPDRDTFQTLLGEQMAALRGKAFSASAQVLYDELLRLVPDYESVSRTERFRPSQETVEWMSYVTQHLLGGLLEHIPDHGGPFDANEARSIFQQVIDDEFTDQLSGQSQAEGWTVVVEKAASVNVRANEKQVVIPEDRNFTVDQLRRLCAHELGVHFLRSVAGSQTTLAPLQTGLAEYADAEEGLGVVVEQAVSGEYEDRGENHYIAAGLAYFEGKTFEEVMEIKWRLSILSGLDDGAEVTSQRIEKARGPAFGNTLRIFRGTDDLPYFKDLSYYNGNSSTWKYLEQHRGDDFALSLLFMGKADPSSVAHRRILLETHSH